MSAIFASSGGSGAAAKPGGDLRDHFETGGLDRRCRLAGRRIGRCIGDGRLDASRGRCEIAARVRTRCGRLPIARPEPDARTKREHGDRNQQILLLHAAHPSAVLK
jgi:hypothetical protein